MNDRFAWYDIVDGRDLEQGDILESCPIYLPAESDAGTGRLKFRWEERDVIVLSQSCDLVEGREKVTDVLLASVWKRSELTEGYLASPKGMEDARRGNLPGVHMLAACEMMGMEAEVRIVDFRRICTLPITHLRDQILTKRKRLRLLPPYREHLSQSFARFFMRVGLPVDIPAFR